MTAPLTQKQIEDEVVKYVTGREYVTFVELERLLKEHIDTTGEFCMELAENVILWVNMSEAWVELMQRLLKEHRLFLHPSEPLVYFMDGGSLSMPLWKGRKTKNPRWAPVCFCSYPHPAVKA